jgi:glycosyltransferase involved in cell wall biosynthesis
MRILVDYQIFLSQKYGGISIYHSIIHRLINEMQTEDRSTIYALGSNNEYIDSKLGLLKPLNYRGKKILRIVNQHRSRSKMAGFDVFHPTYYDDYFLATKKLPPFVLTIHDVIPERFFFDEIGISLQNKRKRLLHKAARIIAVSEATKKGLLHFYQLDQDKITVIPHGRPDYFDPFLTDNDNNPDPSGQPYILFVGKRGSYKNFPFFIRSIAPFLIKHDIRIKIVGPPPIKEELDLIAELNIARYASFEGFATTKQLYGFYSAAFCFVCPALEEGFGIPLLEAAMARCPVICSDIEIFREVCNDAAIYFDPLSPSDILDRLESLLSDGSGRTTLIERGLKNLDRFSWQNAAQKTLDTYRMAAGSQEQQQ